MSQFKIITWIALLTIVTAHKQCSKNTNLWKSIQYQLKLVESSEGRCDCAPSKDKSSHEMVGFLAKSSKNIQNLNGIVVYDTVVTNTGSGYNPSNGRFVAPYEGLYFFSWTTLTLANSYFFTVIQHNGKTIANNHTGARGVTTEKIATTQSVVLQLAADDQVYIKTYGTEKELYGGNWSTFTGFKI